jgi:predicted dehydrogenase
MNTKGMIYSIVMLLFVIIEMERAAKENSRLLTICHVLRYTPFWSAVKRVISQGQVGEAVSIQLNEHVGYWHIAHSFVRGNWSN